MERRLVLLSDSKFVYVICEKSTTKQVNVGESIKYAENQTARRSIEDETRV